MHYYCSLQYGLRVHCSAIHFQNKETAILLQRMEVITPDLRPPPAFLFLFIISLDGTEISLGNFLLFVNDTWFQNHSEADIFFTHFFKQVLDYNYSTWYKIIYFWCR